VCAQEHHDDFVPDFSCNSSRLKVPKVGFLCNFMLSRTILSISLRLTTSVNPRERGVSQ
jgi:hypothetical protein